MTGRTGSQPSRPVRSVRSVRSGRMPPRAANFIARPESGPELSFRPGTAVALVPLQERSGPATASRADRADRADRVSQRAGSSDWLAPTGKTQIAVDFSESARRSGAVTALIWVTANTRAGVLTGYARAATTVLGGDPSAGADAAATRLLSWLGETTDPWLLVLDDIRHADDLRGLFPAGPAGMLVITTSDLLAIPAGRRVRSIQVGPFSPRESLDYLRGLLGADPGQRDGMIELAAALGGEPLALAQAGGTVQNSRLSCREYLDGYLTRRDQISKSAAGPSAAAAVTWTFSAEQADRLSDGGAWSLTTLASVLDGNGFAADILGTEAVASFLGTEPDAAEDALIAAEMVGLLSIDASATPRTVWMSRPLQSAIRTSAATSPLLAEAGEAAADGLELIWPQDEPAPWTAESLRDCVASLRRVTGQRLFSGGCHPVLMRAGQSLDAGQLAAPAETYWNDLMTAVGRTLGQDHEDAVRIARHLAAARLRVGHTGSAARLFEWRRDILVSALGPEHPDALAARIDYGQALMADGQHGEAIEVLTKAAADCERTRGPGQAETASAWDELAAALIQAGQQADAIRLLRRTLADRERMQGSRHLDTLATRRHLAAALLAAGQYKDAIGEAKRALADTERVRGRDHLDTLRALGELGAANRAAGRMAQAVQLLEDARVRLDRALGPDHPVSLARRADLASAYYEVGRLSDASTLLRDTLTRCERVLSPTDPLCETVRETLTSIAGGLRRAASIARGFGRVG